MMKIGYKIPLDVDEETSCTLDSQSKICNWLYNQLLEQANTLKAQFIAGDGQDKGASLTVYSKRGLRNLIPGMKQNSPFLKTVYSSPLKNTALRLTAAIQEFQKSKRRERANGHAVEWPKFRSWKRKWFSLLYDERWKGYKLEGRQLKLSLGKDEDGKQIYVFVQLSEPLPYAHKQVKQLRIVKEIDRFYAVFTVERNLRSPVVGMKRVAYLDPNHKNLAYLVDTLGRGIEIENMPNLKSLDRRIDELKHKRDRCKRKSILVTFERNDGSVHRHWEPSRRWKRYNQALDKLYRLRREQTKTFLFTIANALYKAYDLVAIGNYTPHGGGINKGMRRSMNNQSLIGRFKKALKWVAEREGKLFLEISEYRTTKTCHDCGYVVSDGLPPDVREWDCPRCETHHIRDENSARNGLSRLMTVYPSFLGNERNLVSGSDYPLVEKPRERYTWRAMPSEAVLCTPRGGNGVQSNGQRQDELNQKQPELFALSATDLNLVSTNVQV